MVTGRKISAEIFFFSSIIEAEVRAEIARLRTKSAQGPDGINNKMLRNLDDKSIAAPTKYISDCWEKGNIPQR